MCGDYKPSEREPICPLYLTALPPRRGLAVLQLLLSLFPGIASLHQLTFSSKTSIEKLPEQRLLCMTSSSAKVTVGTPCTLYSIPVLLPQFIHPESLLGFFLLPYLSRENHQLPLFFFSKYFFCFIYFLWPCDRVERTWDVCSKDLCSNTGLPTCWPCGIACFLPLLPPPLPFPTSILSSTTWTALPLT